MTGTKIRVFLFLSCCMAFNHIAVSASISSSRGNAVHTTASATTPRSRVDSNHTSTRSRYGQTLISTEESDDGCDAKKLKTVLLVTATKLKSAQPEENLQRHHNSKATKRRRRRRRRRKQHVTKTLTIKHTRRTRKKPLFRNSLFLQQEEQLTSLSHDTAANSTANTFDTTKSTPSAQSTSGKHNIFESRRSTLSSFHNTLLDSESLTHASDHGQHQAANSRLSPRMLLESLNFERLGWIGVADKVNLTAANTSLLFTVDSRNDVFRTHNDLDGSLCFLTILHSKVCVQSATEKNTTLKPFFVETTGNAARAAFVTAPHLDTRCTVAAVSALSISKHLGKSSATATTVAKASAIGTKKNKHASSKSSAFQSVGGGKEGECLRRIKREWRDAVELGIGYDWINMKTLSLRVESSQPATLLELNDNINIGKHVMNARIPVSNSTTSSLLGDQKLEEDEPFYNKCDYVRIGPLGKNLLRWHFSVSGPPNSEFSGGIYHGRVLLPKDYPGSPPRVQMLTSSGRFQVGADICLSASAYHPELWTPRWTVLSLVDALRLHMLTSANEIGGLTSSKEIRIHHARESRRWRMRGGILGRGVIVDHGHMVQKGLFPHALDDAKRSSGSSGKMSEEKAIMIDEEHSLMDTRLQRKKNGTNHQTMHSTREREKKKMTEITQTERVSSFRTVVLGESGGTFPTSPRVPRKTQRREKHTMIVIGKAIVAVFKSPIRIMLLMFVLLFAILNSN